MTFPAGTPVAIDDDEVETGTGLCFAIYSALKAQRLEASPLPSLYPPPDWTSTTAAWQAEIRPIRLKILRAIAADANGAALGGTQRAIFTINTTSHSVTEVDDVLLVDGAAAGGRVTITLPSAAGVQRTLTIKNLAMGGGSTVVSAAGGETVDGFSSYSLTTDYQLANLLSDGVAQWVSV